MAYRKLYHALGISFSARPNFDAFAGQSNHFTYKVERDPSISSNVHVLQALVLSTEALKHAYSIEKCIRYLCKT